ncbi:hypothetical protein [Engelhardtia mirabilis]|uniref:Uncharacterized protein n=1 Tax=Engelhardtia mirabilis TaxID=2528011 RepID=A0A518BQ38_9BACT|nr:hypothetical protein Pla133_42050 [Planctomycetes bacterium Pla133]QDV03416.1 hypothetical protein Pla86_42040 [Planctomycetes bacterium Pla86]
MHYRFPLAFLAAFAALGSLELHASPTAGARVGDAPLTIQREYASDGGLSLAVAGGQPGDIAILVVAATTASAEQAMERLPLLSDCAVTLIPVGPFDSSGTTTARVHVPLDSARDTASMQLAAFSFTGGHSPAPHSTAPPQSLWGSGLQPGTAPSHRADGIKVTLLQNVANDGGACGETGLPNEMVGMLIPDHLHPTSWYTLDPGATMVEFPDGQALITAQVHHIYSPALRFEVLITLGGRLEAGDIGYPCAGTPYYKFGPLAQCPSYLSGQGGPIDPIKWRCYQSMSGSLVGVDDLAGAYGTLIPFEAAFQAGEAANDKNLAHGASGWFSVTYTSQPFNGPPLPAEVNMLVELFADFVPHAGLGQL